MRGASDDGKHVLRHGEGQVLVSPVDVMLSAGTVLVADLVCFTSDGFAPAVNEKHATAAADLAMEVRSPGTRRRELGRKRVVCVREGVREHWLADPAAKSMTVLRRPEKGGRLTEVSVLKPARAEELDSPLFPRLRVPWATRA